VKAIRISKIAHPPATQHQGAYARRPTGDQGVTPVFRRAMAAAAQGAAATIPDAVVEHA